jgi:uncharacterized membrane protein
METLDQVTEIIAKVSLLLMACLMLAFCLFMTITVIRVAYGYCFGCKYRIGGEDV